MKTMEIIIPLAAFKQQVIEQLDRGDFSHPRSSIALSLEYYVGIEGAKLGEHIVATKSNEESLQQVMQSGRGVGTITYIGALAPFDTVLKELRKGLYPRIKGKSFDTKAQILKGCYPGYSGEQIRILF
jgi:hypothetical protein